MDGKYIIVECGNLPLAICFNGILSHRDVAGGRKVLSAGFFSVGTTIDTQVRAWGESFTLGISSNPEEDVKAIRLVLFGEY